MKKNFKILGLLFLIILVIIYIAILVIKTIDNKNVNSNTVANEYICNYVVSGDDFINTSLEKYNYDIVVNSNNKVLSSTVLIEQHFNDYESFFEYYNKYNSEDSTYGELIAYDFDAYLTVLKKEEKPNVDLNKYKEDNKLSNITCTIKENNQNSISNKENNSDIKYLCTKDSSVYYFAVDNNGIITTMKNGTIHQMKDIEDYNQRSSVLEDNDYVTYLYDDQNLTITQLNLFEVPSNTKYNSYVEEQLKDFECKLME